MIFLLATFAALLYSLQNAFIVRFARSHDPLSVAFYRNAFLAMGMLPILFLATDPALGLLDRWTAEPLPAYFWERVPDTKTLLELFLVGLFGGGSYVCMLTASRYLPLFLINSFLQLSPLLLLTFSYLFLGEVVTSWQLFFFFWILVSVLSLTLQKRERMDHLDYRFARGILLALSFVLLGASMMFFLSSATREINPFVVGYLWELSVGIGFGLLLLVRKFIYRRGLTLFEEKKTYLKLFATVSPIIVASAILPLLVALENPGLIQMVNASVGLLGGLFFGYLLHREVFRWRQAPFFLAVLIGVIGMSIAS